MADLTVEQIKELRENMKGLEGDQSALNAMVDEFSKKHELAGGVVSKFVEAAKQGFESLKNLIESNGGAFTMFTSAIESSDAIEKYGTGLMSAITAGTDLLDNSVNVFGKIDDAGTSAGANIADSFKNVGHIMDKIGLKGASAFAKGVLESAESGRQFEMSLLESAAASGSLGVMNQRTGEGFETLSDVMTTQMEVVRSSAGATGSLISVSSEYANQLAQLPGGLKNVNQNLDIGGESMNGLTATMKVASGTHQSFAQVLGHLATMQKTLGTEQQKGLETIAMMSDVSTSLKMPLETMQNFTMEAASGFKFLGDNTQGAIKIMSGMGKALENSGMGPEAIADLTKGVIGGIQKMDIAHKAFISGASGGKGGLAGGFELDFKLREGKLDEVFGDIQKAMTASFGGPVVTLEQGKESDQMAAELMKQVSYLKDVAGVAGSDDEAYRILEKMQAGNLDQIGDALSPDNALADATDRGTDIQARSYTELTKMENNMQRLVQLQNISNLALIRSSFGVEAAEDYMLAAQEAGSIQGDAGETDNTTLYEDTVSVEKMKEAGASIKKAGEDFGAKMMSLINPGDKGKGEKAEDKAKTAAATTATTTAATTAGGANKPNAFTAALNKDMFSEQDQGMFGKLTSSLDGLTEALSFDLATPDFSFDDNLFNDTQPLTAPPTGVDTLPALDQLITVMNEGTQSEILIRVEGSDKTYVLDNGNTTTVDANMTNTDTNNGGRIINGLQ